MFNVNSIGNVENIQVCGIVHLQSVVASTREIA